jgi:hypothetical protein
MRCQATAANSLNSSASVFSGLHVTVKRVRASLYLWVCLSVGCVDLEVRQTICAPMKNQIKNSQKNKRNICIYVCICLYVCVYICVEI